MGWNKDKTIFTVDDGQGLERGQRVRERGLAEAERIIKERKVEAERKQKKAARERAAKNAE